MTDELVAVADVVRFIVFGIGQDCQDAIRTEIMHLMPEHRRQEQCSGIRTEPDGFFMSSVKKPHRDGP